jgi:hypothetical protein
LHAFALARRAGIEDRLNLLLRERTLDELYFVKIAREELASRRPKTLVLFSPAFSA